MDLIVSPGGTARWGDALFRCALGRAGVSQAKREGDGATPAGRFPMRAVFYRPDRLAAPQGALPVASLTQTDGWCDDPGDPAYNRQISLPYPGRHERLWRDDGLYDLLVALGYNDDPVVPDRGSAIFLHLAARDFRPTEGCLALALEALQQVIAEAPPGACVLVEP
jgi:L,D-peptidoglycan transpeptidase YkuD (ErfK/YbiS/YcfS/YnhG family)